MTDTTRNYETIICHQPDGTVTAQHTLIREIKEANGSILFSKILDPVAISGAGLQAVLGGDLNNALSNIDALNTKIAQLDAQIVLLTNENLALKAVV